MHFKKFAATLLICALPAVSQARDTAGYLRVDKAVAEATRTGKIDGSVKFYLAGNAPAGKVTVVSPGAVTNKKPTPSTRPTRKPASGCCSRIRSVSYTHLTLPTICSV